MARVRLGVVLLLSEPWRSEVDGLRRALGDQNLQRIPPHITLIPPINIRLEDRERVFALVRDVAARTQPFMAKMGPVETFAPKTPVIKLGVDANEIFRLREQLHVAPLAREQEWPFDPHITLNDEAPADVIEHAVAAMGDYEAHIRFEDLWIMRQHDDRVWRPMADARFEKPVVVGTGGLDIEFTVSTLIDPNVCESLQIDAVLSTEVITARRRGEVLGVVAARAGRQFEILQLRVAEGQRDQGIGSQLVQRVRFLAQQQGYFELFDASDCPQVAAILRRFRAVESY